MRTIILAQEVLSRLIMLIREWFSDRRADLGFSLDYLSELSGIASSQIHKIEHGESSLTINAIVRLCFALDISTKEFFSRTELTHPSSYVDVQPMPNEEKPFITFTDIESLLSFFNRRGYAQIIKGFLYKSFYKIIQFAPPEFSTYKKIGTAYNLVGQCIRSTSPDSYTPLPSPGVIYTDYYYLISIFGGALTTNDFGAYLKSIRKIQLEYSVRKIGEILGMSHSTISRIESGKSDLSLFSDLYKMEVILSQGYHKVMGGYLFYIRWLVEEFKTGIVRNREKEKAPPPEEWIWRDYVIADTLIRLNRWYQKHELEDYWMGRLRSLVKKLTTGEIPPFTNKENIYDLEPIFTDHDFPHQKDNKVEELKQIMKDIEEGKVTSTFE